MVYTTKFEQFI